MVYHEFETVYHSVVRAFKNNPNFKKQSPIQFYEEYIHDMLSNNQLNRHDLVTAYNQATREYSWWKANRPYYRFHPKASAMFANTRLDIPLKYIKFPCETLVAVFSEKDPTMKVDDSHYVRSIMVHRGQCVDVETDKKQESFAIYVDIGESTVDYVGSAKMVGPCLTYRQLYWASEEDDKNIEEIIDRTSVDAYYKTEGIKMSREMLTQCVRLVVSLAFLKQDESPIIIPHVLAKDHDEFHRGATKERKEQMHQKAIKVRESIGWQVGFDEMFDLGRIGRPNPSELSDSTGNKREFAHVVNCHWKLVRYGPKREFGRVRFISMYFTGHGKPFKHKD